MAYVASVGASTNPMYASFDGSGTIGGVTFADDDILRFNGSTWSMFFDGSDVGLLSGVDATAFALVDDDTALFVFDTTVILGGVTYEPSDIVQFDATQFGSVTSGSFSMYFNGIDAGLNDTVAEKIDAISILPDNRILISTTGNPSVPSVSGFDEDILAFTPTTLGDTTAGTWAMYFDGSDVELDGADEDVDLVDVVEGSIYLSTAGPGPFSVTGVSGDNQDVFVCSPTSLGDTTGCTYHPTLYFDSSAFAVELGTVNLDAFAFYALGDVPTATVSSTPTNTATNTPTATTTGTATQPAGASTNPMYASFDGSGTIGGVTFADDDIVRFNGTTWSMYFDGSDLGLGSGVDMTAFDLVDDNTALLVFDTTVILGGVTYEPSDIVQFNATQFGNVTSGTFSMYFNGIDVGLDDTVAEKMNSVSILPDNRILISTAGNPTVPSGSGVDEDILAFTPTTLGDNHCRHMGYVFRWVRCRSC